MTSYVKKKKKIVSYHQDFMIKLVREVLWISRVFFFVRS